MATDRLARLMVLEGRRVNVALRDGSRIDDGQLVSAGRGEPTTLWLFWNGSDTFLPVDEVVDLWEAGVAGAGNAA